MLNTGTLIMDESVNKDAREKIVDRISEDLEKLKEEVSSREPVIQKRRNFYEGNQERYTNVVGLTNKMQEGHILAVFNYIMKFVQKLHQVLTNSIPKIKIVPQDEGNEVETIRAEMVEKTISKILRDNKFWHVIFKRCGLNQIRDGDFSFDCKVIDDSIDGKHIEITPTEDLLKLLVWWDDASGSSFSAVAFRDLWTLSKIKREFGIDAQAFSDPGGGGSTQGNHLTNQYGLFATSSSSSTITPTGETKLPKGEVIDYWGYEVIKNEVKVINIIFVNREVKQFVVTDYRKIPRFIGHSFINSGRPWSSSFIDPLMDPQVELNDRTSEEGDLIRVGAHMKFLVVNMPDFDPDSVKPGSGQVIFIEGEGADFRPLINTMTPFPSEAYLTRILDHMFNIGLPKIALSAGTAPYTGRVASIVYQPIIDIVSELRIQWETVLEDLVLTIQQYLIDYFPETHAFMREHIETDENGQSYDGEPVIREVQFDWENVLPLSRSDKVVDASTLRDRHAISLYTYLEEAGFKDPSSEIKRLKKESADQELMTIMEKFSQYAPGVIKAQLDAQRKMQSAQDEQAGAGAAQVAEATGTPKSNTPILNNGQNDGRRGIPSGTGTPTGQTASLKGAVAQKTQNINAAAGV